MVHQSSYFCALTFAAVSVSAFLPTFAWADPDACTPGPVGTLICSGNQQDGIGVGSPPYDTLVVKDLTAPITPPAGTRGINFQSSFRSLILDATVGSQGIVVHNASGVDVGSNTANGVSADIVVSVTGDVSVYGSLIFNAPIAISAGTGDISSTSPAASGSVAVTSRGNLTSSGIGINAATAAWWYEREYVPFAATVTTGDITVHAENVSAQGYAIHAESLALLSVDSFVSGESRSGDVEVKATGNVVSASDHAILAELVANVNTDGPSVWGSVGNVTVDVNNVTTLAAGKSAVAVYMYVSASAFFDRLGALGTASITARGEISAKEPGGTGIYVLNLYDDVSGATINYGDYEVNVLSGSSVTGGPGGYGIYAEATGTITNYGSISAPSGTAIASTFAPTAVENYGLITGEVGLSLGANTFNNHVSGIFNIGNSAYVGTGKLTNDGIVSPHGVGTLGQSTITGNYVQSASGKLVVDADWTAHDADLLSVTGNATLSGTVIVAPQNSAVKSGFNAPQQIVAATGSVTNLGMTAQDTATVDYGLQFDPQAVYLTALVDFRGIGGGLNRNQTAIGTAFNTLTSGGTPAPFLPVSNALLTLPTQAALANAYNQLSPEVYNYEKIDTLFSAEQFSADLMSCKVNDADGYSFIREGQCIWARARARFLDLGAARDSVGADTTVGSFSGGGQFAIAPDWRLGLAAGYDNVSLDTDAGASASGDRAHVGAVLKYNPGPWLFTGAVSGGWSTFDTRRNMDFGGFTGAASADTDVDYFAGRVHLAYLIDAGSWYAMPMLDGVATRLDFDGVHERGGNGGSLFVTGDRDTVVAVTPAVEFGTEVSLAVGTMLRPFIRAGVTWRDGEDLGLTSAFAVAPAVAFATSTALDDVLAEASAGMDLINASGAVLRLQYDGRFGNDTRQSSASLKGSVPF